MMIYTLRVYMIYDDIQSTCIYDRILLTRGCSKITDYFADGVTCSL